ncbi:capsule assembly Wzi family protein [Mucilaginibacter sp. KACC 22063]|uniref:capsule assembly Wzi family protein n=1 Tax=Mucilaginibacter sp. KACC 22063 TaxID=3025666 RepID=UPI0023663989|nr:capsule assembly Wzi family protein [Mucilaginibacter sp. KACC 22063]WDF54002.1 capsule assembly Wzi family protein [Mucilaginibacter sp. KACC 22063]
MIFNYKRALLLTVAAVLFICSAKAQAVFENPNHPVYKYLARQAQKGNINFDDLIQPVSRQEIAALLEELQQERQKLSATEKKELDFYLDEYSEFRNDLTDSATHYLWGKDQYGNRRLLTVNKKDFVFRADPALTYEYTKGKNKGVFKQASGIAFWGQAGKHFSFQAYIQDINESGDGVDSLKRFSPETGIQRTANLNPRSTSVNYSDVRGSITYSWKNGLISLGKDQLLYGYGQNGRLILSDKAPAYPFLRLDYSPVKWLHFNYTLASLQSGIIDSARTYNKGNSLYGNNREIWVNKYMASHSLNFLPIKGLELSVGESMISSDNFDAGYLIPVLFFKAYDQYQSRYKITTGSNGQFFFQASSRNHIPHTHLYATLFIDEIRTETIFDPNRSRNQLGYNLGASVTDVLIPYLTLGMEYTHINPFVYNNLIPAQTYTNQTYLLGDWIGQNADKLIGWISYNPLPKLTTTAQIMYVRKGAEGSVLDQYFAEPQPKFLQQGPVQAQSQIVLEARYEFLHRLFLRGAYMHQKGVILPQLQTSAVPNQVTFGVSYGF